MEKHRHFKITSKSIRDAFLIHLLNMNENNSCALLQLTDIKNLKPIYNIIPN